MYGSGVLEFECCFDCFEVDFVVVGYGNFFVVVDVCIVYGDVVGGVDFFDDEEVVVFGDDLCMVM